MDERKGRSSRTRRRSKKKIFAPNDRIDPLAGLFKKPEPEFPELHEEKINKTPVQETKPRPAAPPKKYKMLHDIDPVVLFAAYHLGVTEDDGYRPQNLHDLARRFNVPPPRINEALTAYDLDSETVMGTDFDMSMAQIDIKVAPAGISKMELARQLYDEFRSSPLIPRNWKEELKHDAEENRKIFDKLK